VVPTLFTQSKKAKKKVRAEPTCHMSIGRHEPLVAARHATPGIAVLVLVLASGGRFLAYPIYPSQLATSGTLAQRSQQRVQKVSVGAIVA
jgi:hypothetical protein